VTLSRKSGFLRFFFKKTKKTKIWTFEVFRFLLKRGFVSLSTPVEKIFTTPFYSAAQHSWYSIA